MPPLEVAAKHLLTPKDDDEQQQQQKHSNKDHMCAQWQSSEGDWLSLTQKPHSTYKKDHWKPLQ